MNFRERKLYHQIHPLKLAADIGVTPILLFFLCHHHIVRALLVGFAEALRDYFRKMIPMGRLGTADELASTAVFLASDESGFITGIDLPVDGGTVSG